MPSSQSQSQSQSRQPPRVLSAEEIRQRQLQASSSSSSPSSSRIIGPQSRRAPANTDVRKTTAYKTASRRWISTIVALPILFYTSWELYERTYGSKVQKRLVTSPRSLEEKDALSSSSSSPSKET